MKNQKELARYIKFFFVKILLVTCSVIKTLRIITGFQLRALGSCLQKSINVNKNQRGARYVQLCFIKILPTKPGKSLDYMPSALLKFLLQCGAPGSCLQKSINANKNQRGARYSKVLSYSKGIVNLPKKYCYVSANFGELK